MSDTNLTDAVETKDHKPRGGVASDPQLIIRAVLDALVKLDPRTLYRNPVMFVVEIGSVITTTYAVSSAMSGGKDFGFFVSLAVWLWFTVLFANFAEAMAEGRGKAQADALRSLSTDTTANRQAADGTLEVVAASDLRKGDKVVVVANEIIPGDGDVIEGIASVDESAITGESAPVIRESGGDRSAVTGGTKVLSDRIVVLITSDPGKTFLELLPDAARHFPRKLNTFASIAASKSPVHPIEPA